MNNITTAELQLAFIGTTMLFYGIQWIAVNLMNDKKSYNLTFIACGLLQFITIALISVADKSVI